jgi:hypothetical protein
MSTYIIASNVRNVCIFDQADASQELSLCKPHRDKLQKTITNEINKIVSSKLFQTKFADFLPVDDSEQIDIHIQIKEHEILVQKMDEKGNGIGILKSMKLDEIRGLKDQEEIPQGILKKTNKIYQEHLNERQRSHGSTCALHDHSSHQRQTKGIYRARPELSPPTVDISEESYKKMIQIANGLANEQNKNSTTMPSELMEEFNALAEKIRNDIFYQTYLLIGSPQRADAWQIGEKLFRADISDLKADNMCRAHAIRHFLIHSLATEFAKTPGKTPPLQLLERFNLLQEDERKATLMQLRYTQQRKGHEDTLEAAHDSFYHLNARTATNQERHQALIRALLKRIVEYQRHLCQNQLDTLTACYQEAFERLQSQLRN